MPRPSTQSSPVLLCEETNSSDAVRRGFSDPDVRLTNDRSVIYAQVSGFYLFPYFTLNVVFSTMLVWIITNFYPNVETAPL